jgi:hypothetical protein
MSREAEVTITATFYFRITGRLSSCDCDARSRTPARSLISGSSFTAASSDQKPKAPPRKRERIAPPSLPLDCPPLVADMLAGLGLTHDIIAARVGISRQQVTRRPKLKANRL